MKTPDWSLSPYTPDQKTEWDRLVLNARNGHFIFCRDYMDYHADRFQDRSLVLRRGRKIVAVLPAHQKNNELVSHAGLSFGGWIQAPACRFMDIEAGFDLVGRYMATHEIKRLRYTPSPGPYHNGSCGEDLYLLPQLGARLSQVRLSAFAKVEAILQCDHELRRRLRRGYENLELEFFETDDIPVFWQHLQSFLLQRHGSRPVHTLEEIRLLKCRFPERIRFVVGTHKGNWVVGNTIFLHPRVLKFQYGFRDEACSDQMTVFRLWEHISLHEEFRRPWIDLGTSMEPVSNELQKGVHFNKETFGARGIPVCTWIWEI